MTTTNIDGYTIEELEKESDTKVRTIRFYISEGLLEAPSVMGPKARYYDEHLLRLKVIAHLKKKLKLSEIKEVLSDKTLDLHAILAEADLGRRPLDSASLKKIVNPTAVPEITPAPRNFSFATIGTTKPSIDIYSRLNNPPEPDCETWQRFRPVDGIEIQIREDVDQKTRELVMQLINQLRK